MIAIQTLTSTAAPTESTIANAQAGEGLAATAVTLVVAGIALAPLIALAVLRARPGRNVFFARWGFSHAVLAVLGGLAVYLLGGLLPDSELKALLRPDLLLLGAAAVAIYAAERSQPEGWRSLGLHRGKTVHALLAGIGGYLVALPLIVGLALGWPLLLGAFGAEPREVGVAVRMAALEGGDWTVAALVLVVGAPIVREIVLRGFLQPLFVQNFSERGGVFLAALMFALLQPVELFGPAIGVGLVLGLIQQRTHSLVATTVTHGLHQALFLAAAGAWPGVAPVL